MRPFGCRNKKLTVAFHFQYANQAAWKCDACRAQGLEKQRRCGWIDFVPDQPERPVWARGGIASTSCPKSLITAESLAFIELFFAWKAGGGAGLLELPARTAEAFLILERQWKTEIENADE